MTHAAFLRAVPDTTAIRQAPRLLNTSALPDRTALLALQVRCHYETCVHNQMTCNCALRRTRPLSCWHFRKHPWAHNRRLFRRLSRWLFLSVRFDFTNADALPVLRCQRDKLRIVVPYGESCTPGLVYSKSVSPAYGRLCCCS